MVEEVASVAFAASVESAAFDASAVEVEVAIESVEWAASVAFAASASFGECVADEEVAASAAFEMAAFDALDASAESAASALAAFVASASAKVKCKLDEAVVVRNFAVPLEVVEPKAAAVHKFVVVNFAFAIKYFVGRIVVVVVAAV